MRRLVNRSLGAIAVGLGLVGIACGAAREPVPTSVGSTPPGELREEQAGSDSGPPDDAGSDSAVTASDGGCLYGRLEDPHRGFVRCLAQNEVDAGWLPPPPQGDVGDAGGGASASAPAIAQSPPNVEIGDPAFENGDVPKAAKFLTGLQGAIGKCIGDNGGLSGSAGKMKLQFLVRTRGRAEGVEVQSAKGVSEAAKECVRVLVKNRQVGIPTAEAVGVTVTITVTQASPKPQGK